MGRGVVRTNIPFVDGAVAFVVVVVVVVVVVAVVI